MSVQAMSWALSRRDLGKDSSARHVLLCLANYAGTDGRGAFPSAKTLTDDTGLSERTVRLKLDLLEERGLIVRGNQALAAVYIDRHDRRPVVYDLMIKRGAAVAPREDGTGCSQQQNGVQPTTERGAATAPNPSLNHQLTEQQQPHVFADVADAQDLEALEQIQSLTDTRQRVAMFAQWQPDQTALSTQLKLAGLAEGHTIDEAVLNSFKGFFIAKPDKRETAAGWTYQLARWIKREFVDSQTTPAPGSFDDDDTDWIKQGGGQ